MDRTIRKWTPYQQQRAKLAYDRAVKFGDPDPEGFVAQLYAESKFSPDALSSANAHGEAQFIPATAARFGVDTKDPDSSQMGALRYRKYIREYNAKRGIRGEDYVLAGYNAGEGNAARALTGFKETRGYVANIHAYKPQIAALLGMKPGQTAAVRSTPADSSPAQYSDQNIMPYIATDRPAYARPRSVNFDKLFGSEPQNKGISADYDENDIMGSMYRSLAESVKRTLLGE